ncbi:TetR-like C-terminal domain-containing protein [Streptomyces sp. NPDC002671]
MWKIAQRQQYLRFRGQAGGEAASEGGGAGRKFFEPRMQRWQERLDVAVAAGELWPDVSARTVVELLFGPVYCRLLIGTAALDPEDATDGVDCLLRGLMPR